MSWIVIVALFVHVLILAAIIYVVAWLAELLVVKCVLDNPANGLLTSLGFAFAAVLIYKIYHWGFSVYAIAPPVLALLLIAAFKYRGFKRLLAAQAANGDVFQ